MPVLFISYKRGTAAVAPLMEQLEAAHYRLWFDRDEIHLGDPNWRARIDEGLTRCGGMILCLTPAACASEPVQYEVRKARDLGKPIFPMVLEKLADWGAALRQIGLDEAQHTEDLTDATQWRAQIERLIRDLHLKGLAVTRHDRRQQRSRSDPTYVLHQKYLTRLVERLGTLNLAQITPDGSAVPLEQVYIDSPTTLQLSVEINNWRVMDWWLEARESRKAPGSERAEPSRLPPEALGYERAPLEQLIARLEKQIAAYRAENPEAKPDDDRWRNPWANRIRRGVQGLEVGDVAAARDRLVILGAPGSGKSTYVKHLALCLAGAQIDGWARPAGLAQLGIWPHGRLTPVYVELRRFVASACYPPDLKTQPDADHLWRYILAELGEELRGYADDLALDLEQGQAVLILDGLDEVDFPEGKLTLRQTQLQSLARALNERYRQSRILVASRPYAYEGWKLPGFESVTIADFSDRQRVALAERLYRAAGRDESTAQDLAKKLNNQLRPVDPQLKDRPLFLTLMATIFLKNLDSGEAGLPTRRGTLYRRSILLLLDRWTRGKPGIPSLSELLDGATPEDVYARLASLAYEVHNTYGERPGTPEIDETLLYRHLKPMGREVAARLIPYLSANAAVLVSPGQDAQRDVFHFAHRTFQEYLAAEHLISLCQQADSYAQAADLIQAKPQVWREPGTLAADVLVERERASALWELVDDLIGEDALPDALPADAPRWWTLWLAARIVEEQGMHQQARLSRGERAIRDGLIDGLVRLAQTAQALPPPERATGGRALGMLGDPRPGVGLRPDGLPDITWCEVPAGEFIFQDNQRLTLPRFWVAKYPITYCQFQAFLDADDGFKQDRWWEGLSVPDNIRAAPGDQAFKYWNHPREGVSWYEAVAFCRWLNEKIALTPYPSPKGEGLNTDFIPPSPLVGEGPGVRGNYVLRLPTEAEWEKAARGANGLIYPYGNDFDPTKGNTDETGIGPTSAVGIFPEGASPYGALDMSGNVWEWTLTEYGSRQDENIRSDAVRAVRGGSWLSTEVNARASSRSYRFPNDRFNFQGFRLVCAAPVSHLH